MLSEHFIGSVHSSPDGGPSQQFLISSSYKQLQVEVQENAHDLRASTSSLEAVYKPSFVHCIS